MCATILALIFLAASCGGAESGGDSSAPSFEIPGSGGNAGGGNSGNGGNKDDSQDNDNPTNNPKDEPSDTNVQSILQEILGEGYDSLSGKLSSNITLTAQTIVDVTDIFPVLTAAVKDSNKKALVAELLNGKSDYTKSALIAQAENKLTVTKGTSSHIIGGLKPFDYTISAQGITIKLSGDFDFNKYYFIKNSSTTVDLSDANFYNNYSITVDQLSEFHSSFKNLSSSTLPKLTNANLRNSSPYEDGVKKLFDILDDYSFSNDKLSGLIINWNDEVLNGKSWSNNDYLFTGNTENTSTKMKLDIEKLIKFTSKTGVNNIKNIRITGSLSKSETVSWTNLTNVIFEGDMSQLTINNKTNLNGIVYFKNSPYNNSNISTVFGSLKLDKMAPTINVDGDGNGKKSFVLDISGISNFFSYSETPLIRGSHVVNAVYFNKDQQTHKGSELYKKVADEQSGMIDNVYFGGQLENGEYYHKMTPPQKTSDKARTLQEFEYLGNDGTYSDGGTVA